MKYSVDIHRHTYPIFRYQSLKVNTVPVIIELKNFFLPAVLCTVAIEELRLVRCFHHFHQRQHIIGQFQVWNLVFLYPRYFFKSKKLRPFYIEEAVSCSKDYPLDFILKSFSLIFHNFVPLILLSSNKHTIFFRNN